MQVNTIHFVVLIRLDIVLPIQIIKYFAILEPK